MIGHESKKDIIDKRNNKRG